MQRYELFRMRSRESQALGGAGRVLPTTERPLGCVGMHKRLSTRPGPFRTPLNVRIDACDEAANVTLVQFANEATSMDLALATPESTIYVDGATVLCSSDALVLAVSGGLYDEPGDARPGWREALQHERVANDAYVEVPSKRGFLRGKLFGR